jgi:hypothetical protein
MTRQKKLVAAGLLAATAAIATAVPAQADSNDDWFIWALKKHGIQVVNTSEAISYAHGICARIAAGISSEQREAIALRKLAPSYTMSTAALHVQDAVVAYCPTVGGSSNPILGDS